MEMIRFSSIAVTLTLFALAVLAACASEPQATAEPQIVEVTRIVTVEAPAKAGESSRLDIVRERGRLVCASSRTAAGFGFFDEDGGTTGFDIDLCRAVAVAVLGDANAVEFRNTIAAERGPALQSGEVDMMSRNTTWTSSRDAQWGNFAQTMFYDGQGFMVRKDLGVGDMMELAGARVCVQQGTTSELNLQDFNNQNKLNLEVITFETGPPTTAAYDAKQCDAMTTDRSGPGQRPHRAGRPVGPRHPARHHFRGATGPGGSPRR